MRSIGGVHSQTQTLQSDGKSLAQFELTLDIKDGKYLGHVIVQGDGSALKYPISYDDLVPVALFVDGSGTSLYTAWSADGMEDKNFTREAGFAPDETRGAIAIEFKNSRFNEALRYIDFCQNCLGDEDTAIPNAMNKLNFKERLEDIEEKVSPAWDTYFNTDVGTKFSLSAKNGIATVGGKIVRIDWGELKDRDEALVLSAQAFIKPGEFSAKLASWPQRKEEVRKALGQMASELVAELAKDDEDNSKSMELISDLYSSAEELIDGEEEALRIQEEAPLLRDAFFLYESLGLLRSFRASTTPEKWNAFMSSVRDLSKARPEPWIAYTEAYREVLPE